MAIWTVRFGILEPIRWPFRYSLADSVAASVFSVRFGILTHRTFLVVGLSGGSLAEEPACVALPPRDLVGILRSVEVARFKTGEVLHTTALHECQKSTDTLDM